MAEEAAKKEEKKSLEDRWDDLFDKLANEREDIEKRERKIGWVFDNVESLRELSDMEVALKAMQNEYLPLEMIAKIEPLYRFLLESENIPTLVSKYQCLRQKLRMRKMTEAEYNHILETSVEELIEEWKRNGEG